MEITEANAREAAAAAERLLRDPFLAELLDEMVALRTNTAINGPTADHREDARRQVIAIVELRGHLVGTIDGWRSAAQTLMAQRAHE